MSFVSRLIDPNPPLTAAQVQAVVSAALTAQPASEKTTVRSIQRGTIMIPSGINDSGTVTVTAVSLSKSTLTFLGFLGGASNSGTFGGARVVLTGPTEITWHKAYSNAAPSVSYELFERV